MELADIIGNLLLVLFLVFMNGFFVAAEFSCVKVRASRIETLIKEGNTKALYAKGIVDNLNEALSATQLGITLASLGLGWVGEPFFAKLLLPVTQAMGFDDVLGHTISFVIAFSLITAMHIILGELAPKTMAIQRAENIMLTIALPLMIFEKIMRPFVYVLNHMANWTLHRMGYELADESAEAHTEEELRILMKESRARGFIDDDEADYAENAFNLRALNAREIMVPRTDMVCIYIEDPIEETLSTIFEEQMTRYPICYADKDHIIGFLHVKDLMRVLHENAPIHLRRLARKVMLVPESMDVNDLLKAMQTKRTQIAIVVDEYGGTSGMLTLEDIVEEIVGDIQDEFDEERCAMEERGSGVYSLDAKMLLEEVEDELSLAIEDADVDSIGGWLYDQIGTTPRIGHMAAHEGARFFVEEVAGVRITRVLCALPAQTEQMP